MDDQEQRAADRPQETVYDRDISPLMSQILELCKTNGIGVFAHFVLDRVDGDTTYCTSSIRSANGDNMEHVKFRSLESIALGGVRATTMGCLHGTS